MKTIMRNKSLMRLAVCLIGMAALVLQSCADGGTDRDRLCGSWTSVDGKSDVLVYKEGEAYKVTVFKRSGIRRRLKPETYLLQEENGNLFMNTLFRSWWKRTATSLSIRGTVSMYPTTRRRIS